VDAQQHFVAVKSLFGKARFNNFQKIIEMLDREDGWEYEYNNAYGYQDAAYGYDNYHVDLNEYQNYFREGFRRGYEDGYYGRSNYGRYSSGKHTILGAVVGQILDFVLD
jgi:hypothetical protein